MNRLLAAGLEATTHEKWQPGNLSLRCKEISAAAAGEAIRTLPDLDWERLAASAAREMSKGMLSKFQPCLPEEAEDRLLAERLLDRTGTLHFLANVKVNGTRLAARPAGLRLVEALLGPAPLELSTPAASQTDVATPRNPVEWVDTPAALRAACAELRAAEVVGLDVETTLDLATLCLVQLATPSRTYLVDPFAVGDLAPLGDVLGSASPLKVIHNARFERRALAGVGIAIEGEFDTLEASRRLRGRDALGGHGLAMVCELELGLRLDKSAQTSNWARRPLDAEQLRYAALDAEVLVGLRERLVGGEA